MVDEPHPHPDKKEKEKNYKPEQQKSGGGESTRLAKAQTYSAIELGMFY